jgi:hypothetical protein
VPTRITLLVGGTSYSGVFNISAVYSAGLIVSVSHIFASILPVFLKFSGKNDIKTSAASRKAYFLKIAIEFGILKVN